jgi:3-deoxy-D-manno-octulosonic-acid transferase
VRRWLYIVVMHALIPFALLHLAWRARRQPAYLAHVGERFGRRAAPGPGPWLWVHAVSVGETRAAQPLVAALLARYPDHGLLLTHGTPTGRETGEQLFGDRVARAYLPYDLPWAVNRFLRAWRPRAGILMETELWPALIAGAGRAGTPMLLVNARLSERSARGYGRVPGLTRDALSGLTVVAAQGRDDAARLTTLGARDVAVMGNLKFDVTPPTAQIVLGRTLRERFGSGRAVWLAASTREGEEAIVLDALAAMPDTGALLVIVPRHPQRFDEVARLVEARGFDLQRRSGNAPVAASTRVVLGDSMGEMFAYFGAADVAFVGGSLVPTGGQNLIEACAVGTPVLIGPHTFNFADATEAAIRAGAALRVSDENALARAVTHLLGDATARDSMRVAGLAFAAEHRGATDRVLRLLEETLSRAR